MKLTRRAVGSRSGLRYSALCLLASSFILLLIACKWSPREAFFHPPVERRVAESLALPPVEPPVVDPDSFRFAVFGDPQVHADGFHRLGRLRADIGPRRIDFVLVLGDLTHDATAAENALIRAALDSLDVPWYATVGNHDLYRSDGWTEFKRLYGAGCKSFLVGGRVRIILFDTASGVIGPTQFDWLVDQLALPGVKVLGTHYPLYDGGEPVLYRLASEAERYSLSTILRDARAWGLFSGHIHAFRAAEAAGVRFITCGSMAPTLDYGEPGYVLCTFSGNSLRWEFVPVD